MKKLLLLMLAGFLSPTLAKGQNAIILQMKDGSKNVVSLEAPSSGTDPSITFDGSEMVITGGKTLRVKLSDVLRYTYGDASTGIQEIGDATLLIRSFVAKAGETVRFSLSKLPSGVYLLKNGSVTYKILKP